MNQQNFGDGLFWQGKFSATPKHWAQSNDIQCQNFDLKKKTGTACMKQGLSCIPWFEVQDSNLSNAPLLDFLVTCNKTTVCAVEEGRMKCSNNGCANERKRSGGNFWQNLEKQILRTQLSSYRKLHPVCQYAAFLRPSCALCRHMGAEQATLHQRLVSSYPPPMCKQQPGQVSDGQTGSWCLDKAVQPRDAWYQKQARPKNLVMGMGCRLGRVHD
jgi:hypothetical protein